MSFSKLFKTLSDILDKVIGGIVFTCIVGMIVIVTLQIISRVFFRAIVGTEELSRYLLVWASFLGATMAYKRGMHTSVQFLLEKSSKLTRKTLLIVGILLCMFFFAASFLAAFKLISLQIFQISPALKLPMRFVYLALPISFSVMLIHSVSLLLENLSKKDLRGQ
ncbi:TRAP transporter small permease [Pseudothermotoga thermarum]|uniref:Tripartite ATP-independent periplasmic transporter DctQ component n=1 Tax=Pseudothermotoga thermarum DSM 5069 TaxID=688269 RepID=F7YV13_9THEM|nr:TRAP transporter small permease [Pseudothermotoga thermarum]AEH50297.1 Tripartite ATP-independent periplasmic transporter DctQ component [Pseudothermotoga thermarum DSM 5069]